MDKFVAYCKALYLVPNSFQIWAWILTLLAILFLIKPTRRFGGIWFLVVLASMTIFFGVMKMANDFAPKEIAPQDLQPATSSRRRHH